jgi:hypothetical protein
LSAVGAALPCGGEVCAIVVDVNASAPTSKVTIVNIRRFDLIANSFRFLLPTPAATDRTIGEMGLAKELIFARYAHAAARDSSATSRPAAAAQM